MNTVDTDNSNRDCLAYGVAMTFLPKCLHYCGKNDDSVQLARRGLAVTTPDVSIRDNFQNNCVCVSV